MVLIQLDFIVLLLVCWTFTRATVPEGLSRIFLGGYTNIKTVQLLNQLCNQSQNKDLVSRDACYGCFFRATNRPSGYPMLLAMSSCAETYLDDEDYGHCQTYLKNATINIESKANPPTIYCTFLECVRQVNKDALDALVVLRPVGTVWAILNRMKRSPDLLITRYVYGHDGICIVRRKTVTQTSVRPQANPIIGWITAM